MKTRIKDTATMEPDTYGGDRCDQIIPRWAVEYPKHGKDYIHDDLKIGIDMHPPGTEVIIKEPVCPACDECFENCTGVEPPYKYPLAYPDWRTCDFDWEEWARNHFS